jgi:uncharacterized membrane protein YuzA (DUF378 family)
MYLLRLQDNPIVAKSCLFLISIASINYIFLAFGKNPIFSIIQDRSIVMFIYILIGLCGIQLFFNTFDVKKIVPTVRGLTESALDRTKKGFFNDQNDIQTLENFRHRYRCGCSA